MRRGVILGLCAVAIVAGKMRGQAVSGLKAITVASGLSQPVFVTAQPGDFNDLFIVQQTGQIVVLNLETGNITPFLDIQSRLTSTSGEQGLLGMAFDPDYATNGKFYLNYTIPGGAFGHGTTISLADASAIRLFTYPDCHA
jgi:glucose/arabinose dehydrogenase